MFNISEIQYISQGDIPGFSHLQLIEKACMGGADWIQLRVKEEPAKAVKEIALEAKKICDSYGARLIINDFPEVAREIGANGVHLGKTDMDPLEARKLLGYDFIIGGTANTLNDVLDLSQKKVDYIGYGPFRFTSTKKNLSPIVGDEGFKVLMDFCRENSIDLPIIAIGGITENDLEVLLKTGVYGVAISSVINHAEDQDIAMAGFSDRFYSIKENLVKEVK